MKPLRLFLKIYSWMKIPGGFLILALLPILASAAPSALTYQGRILKTDGSPLEYSTVGFIFQITNPSGSCIIYQEQVSGYDMTNSSGVFDVPIGTGTVAWPSGGSFSILDSFNNSNSYSCGSCAGYTCSAGSGTYNPLATDGRVLRVQFYDGYGWKTVAPDTTIRSVPYAGYSLSAQKLGTNTASDFVLKSGVNGGATCGSGSFLTWDSATQSFGCAAVSGASGGTVTDVTANAPLSVTNGTSTPNISMLAASSSQNGYLTSTDWTNFNNKLGTTTSFSGDVSGTSSTMSVDKLKGTALSVSALSSGQYLKYNGTNWVNSTIAQSDVSGLTAALSGYLTTSAFNTDVASASCTSSQTMYWNSVSSVFDCQNISVTSFSGSLAGDVSGTQSATSVDKLKGTALNISSLSSDQFLKYNGTNWVNSGVAASDISGLAASATTDTTNASNITSGTLAAARLPSGGYDDVYFKNGGNSFGSAATLGTTDNNTLSFLTNATNRMTINSSGNVGIGTTSPSSLLDVAGGVTSQWMLVKSPTDTSISVSISNPTANNAWNIYNLASTDPSTPNALLFENCNGGICTRKMSVFPSGSVGIGTTYPTGKLEVNGGPIVARTDSTNGILGALSLEGVNSSASFPNKTRWTLFNMNEYGSETGLVFNEYRDADGNDNYCDDSGACTTRMIIAPGGNVGIGITAPQATLDVSSVATNVATQQILARNTSNLAGNVAGVSFVFGGGAAGNNNSGGGIYAKVVQGSPLQTDLYFRNNLGDNSNSPMMIRYNGYVGIGTSAPTALLHVNGSALASAWNTSSDIRLKENIVEIQDPLEKILQLRGVNFDWRRDVKQPTRHDQTHDLGVIAQEVEKQFPEAVSNDPNGFKSVAYSKLVAPLIGAVKELYARFLGLQNRQDRQDRRLASVQADNAAKDQRIEQLERENAAKTQELEAIRRRLDQLEAGLPAK